MKSLYVLFCLDLLNMAVFLPAFGPFIRVLGGTPAKVGLMNSSCALISLLWNPIIGSLSDQIGRRELLTKCILANMLGCLIMAFSYNSMLIVFIGRLVGAFGSPASILLRTVVTDIYQTPEGKKAFFDKVGPFMSLMFLSGSLISGFLSETTNGYTRVFLVMVGITGTSAYVANTKLPNDAKKTQKKGKKLSFTRKAVTELKSAVINMKNIDWSRYWDIFVIKGGYDFSLNILFSNLGLILVNEFNLQGRQMGFVFLYMSIIAIISNLLKLKFKKSFDRIPDFTKIVYGGLIMAVAFAGLSLGHSLYVFMFFLGFMGMLKAFMETTFTEIITTKTLESDRGKVISAFDNLTPLALFIVPALSGFFSEVFGQRVLMASAVVPLIIVISIAYRRKSKTA